MTATITTVTQGTIAGDIRDGQTIAVNGHVVAVDYAVTNISGDDLMVTVTGYVTGMGMRTFRMLDDAPVTIIG